jgi:LacI family transcriptional regulator
VPSIGFRTDATVGAAVDYLAGLAPAAVAMALYDLDNEPEYRLQRDQFMQLAAQRGLNCAWFDAGRQRGIYESPPRITVRGQERLRAFLRRLPKPAAVWAADDFMGYIIVQAAQAIGLVVPDQLAVLGLGDYAVARWCHPHLSTIPQPGDLIGFEAMRVLDGLMTHPGQAPRTTALHPPPVVARGSTRAVFTANEQMQQVHDYIAEHACRGMTAEDLLRVVPVSMPTLDKRFMALFGRTPAAEIRRVKLEKARFYLRETSLSVTRVANLCGFDQHVNFDNFFKRNTSLTPTDYRAKVARATSQGQVL